VNTEKLNFSRFENLVAEREKLAALSHKLSELQEQKQKLEVEATQTRKFNLRDQAEMVLDGTYETRDFNREIEQLDNSIEVHQQAVNLQNQRLHNLKAFCSKNICDEIQPDYRQIVRKMRDAAHAMIAAMELEAKFIDELQRRDIAASYLGRIFLPKILDKDALQAFIRSTEEKKEG